MVRGGGDRNRPAMGSAETRPRSDDIPLTGDVRQARSHNITMSFALLAPSVDRAERPAGANLGKWTKRGMPMSNNPREKHGKLARLAIVAEPGSCILS